MANSIISSFGSLFLSGDAALSLTFDIGLTVYLARVYLSLRVFGLSITSVGFWYLTNSSTIFQPLSLILILSSEVSDFDEETSFLISDSWILSNIDFLSKSDKAESVFAVVSSKIHKSLTLKTLFYSLT